MYEFFIFCIGVFAAATIYLHHKARTFPVDRWWNQNEETGVADPFEILEMLGLTDNGTTEEG